MSLDSSSNFFGGMFKIQQVPLMCQLGKDKQKQTATNAILRQITCCFRTLKSNRRKIKNDVTTIVFPSRLLQTSPLFTLNNFVRLFHVRVLFQALKVLTTLTTYCLQMGHSASCLPQLVQVAMWPHSSITQSTAASQQILHKSWSSIVSFSESI